MEGWKTEKIEKIFTLGRGRVINDEEIKEHPGIYPVYSSQTSNNGEFGKVDFFEFEGEYITWTTDGANAGKVFYRSGRFNCTNVCGTLKAKNPKEICTKYFAYLIDRHAFRHVAVVGNNKLMNNVMGKIKITFPIDITQQSAIAHILSTVDEAIRSTRETISKLERVKKALMQNLLSGKMKPDGTLRPAAEFYEDDKMGLVPKGWKSVKLKEVADIQRGKFGHRPRNDERFYNGQYPFVQTSDVVNSIFYLKGASQSLNDLGKSVSRSFPKGTIIMTIAANIGYVAITEYEVFFPDSLIGINANEDIIDADYLMLNLMGYKNILDAQATESAQKNINYSNLRPLLIMFPTDKDEQKSIVQSIKNIYKQIDNKQEKITALELLKKSLMQQLLTGKVRVK